jgi:uncharacterized protein YndB with AHSA1/START domain
MSDSHKTDSTPAGPSSRDEERRLPPSLDTARSVVTECDLPEAPEKVWKALTVPRLLTRWLPDAIGSEILVAEPNRLLRYRWAGTDRDRDADGRPLESVVTFELTGTSNGGTHLRVTHGLLVDAVVVARAGVAESASVIPFGPPRRGEPVAQLRWAA